MRFLEHRVILNMSYVFTRKNHQPQTYSIKDMTYFSIVSLSQYMRRNMFKLTFNQHRQHRLTLSFGSKSRRMFKSSSCYMGFNFVILRLHQASHFLWANVLESRLCLSVNLSRMNWRIIDSSLASP